MKICSQLLAFTLAAGMPALCAAETVVFDFDARVVSILNFGGTTDATSHFAQGDLFSFSLAYDTDAIGVYPYSHMGVYSNAIEAWTMDFANGFSMAADDGYMDVYNDSTWDGIFWGARNQGHQGGIDQIVAPQIGNAKLVTITAALYDNRLTALSSTDLVPFPPFSAFTSSYVNLVFRDVQAGTVTQINGRITNLDEGTPPVPTLACSGFRAPFDGQPVRARDLKRSFPLKASLADAGGAAVEASQLISPPNVMVTHVPSVELAAVDVTAYTTYSGLGSEGFAFVFADGEWRYNLKGKLLQSPGTYLISMTSPDQREYVIEPTCSASIVVD